MVYISWSLLTTYVSLFTSNSRPVYRKYFDLQVCLHFLGFSVAINWSRGTAEDEEMPMKTPLLVLLGEN